MDDFLDIRSHRRYWKSLINIQTFQYDCSVHPFMMHASCIWSFVNVLLSLIASEREINLSCRNIFMVFFLHKDIHPPLLFYSILNCRYFTSSCWILPLNWGWKFCEQVRLLIENCVSDFDIRKHSHQLWVT